jgi:hypothetical protein
MSDGELVDVDGAEVDNEQEQQDPKIKRWRHDECTRLVELFRAGATDREIAEQIDRSERACTLKRNDLGVVRYQRNTKPIRDEHIRQQNRILREGLDNVLDAARMAHALDVAEVALDAIKRADKHLRAPVPELPPKRAQQGQQASSPPSPNVAPGEASSLHQL